MSEIVLTGVITHVLPLQQGQSQRSGNTWQKQSYVLQHEGGQYPRSVCFDVFGAEKIKNFNIHLNEPLRVYLNIDARQNPNNPSQFFNSIDCWKVEHGSSQPAGQPQAPMNPGAQAAAIYPQPPVAAAQPRPTSQAPANSPASPQQFDNLPF